MARCTLIHSHYTLSRIIPRAGPIRHRDSRLQLARLLPTLMTGWFPVDPSYFPWLVPIGAIHTLHFLGLTFPWSGSPCGGSTSCALVHPEHRFTIDLKSPGLLSLVSVENFSFSVTPRPAPCHPQESEFALFNDVAPITKEASHVARG